MSRVPWRVGLFLAVVAACLLLCVRGLAQEAAVGGAAEASKSSSGTGAKPDLPDADAYVARASEAAAAGDLDDAIADFSAALAIDPRHGPPCEVGPRPTPPPAGIPRQLEITPRWWISSQMSRRTFSTAAGLTIAAAISRPRSTTSTRHCISTIAVPLPITPAPRSTRRSPARRTSRLASGFTTRRCATSPRPFFANRRTPHCWRVARRCA